MTSGSYQKVAAMVRRTAGIDLAPLGIDFVTRRTAEFSRVAGLDPNPEKLTELLAGRQQAALRRLLAEHLTVTFTKFFRVPQALELFARDAVPEAIAARSPSGKVHVLSAGCSTGEEAYSLAIAIRESQPDIPLERFQITGCDISTAALNHARKGVYSEANCAWLKRFCPDWQAHFRPHKLGWQVCASIRDCVKFRRINLARRLPELPKFDVVFLCNVFWYLGRAGWARLIERLRPRLASHAWLFVGEGESLRGTEESRHWTTINGRGWFAYRARGTA